MVNEANYFILKYKKCGEGCPVYLSGKWNQPRWEWENYETKPHDVIILNEYEFRVTDREIKSLEFDLYGHITKYVSEKFVKLCEELEVKFRAVPLKFIVRKKPVDKKYFIFLPVDHVHLLDREKSTFSDARNAESGELLVNKIYAGQVIYNNITKFVPLNGTFPHVFQCSELLELVCTREFMRLATEQGLKCIDFIPIDENFAYDAWAD